MPQEEQSAHFTPYIQLTIAIPNTSKIEKPAHFLVRAEMGNKTDENILELPQGHELDTPHVTLMLNDLEKVDLTKYSNIKITISEGKYKSKVFGYIPIEMIKSLISQENSEKTTILQVKGKQFIGFGSIQCTIRADFPSNNILNSDVLGSFDRDHSSYQKYREKSR